MSTTIRVSRKDKEELVNLGKRLGTKTMSATLRKAIALARASDESFNGKTEALGRTLRFARASGSRRTSEHVDKELARALHAE
jgi:hypothetical protein